MTDVRVTQEILVQGSKAGEMVEAMAHGRSAWLQVFCGDTGPKVVVWFDEGMAGHRQVVRLIEQLERVAKQQLVVVEEEMGRAETAAR